MANGKTKQIVIVALLLAAAVIVGVVLVTKTSIVKQVKAMITKATATAPVTPEVAPAGNAPQMPAVS